MHSSISPIVLLPVLIAAASIYYVRRCGLRTSPATRLHALAGLFPVSSLVLISPVPFLRLIILAALPAWLILLGFVIGARFTRLPRGAVTYVNFCVAAAPFVIVAVFIAAIILDW